MKTDKILHALAGVITYAAGFIAGLLVGFAPGTAFLAGMGATALVAGAKEYWDSLGHGIVDSADFYATVAGGLAAAVVITLLSL